MLPLRRPKHKNVVFFLFQSVCKGSLNGVPQDGPAVWSLPLQYFDFPKLPVCSISVMGRQIAWIDSVVAVLCVCGENVLSFCHDFITLRVLSLKTELHSGTIIRFK